jgi:hypothetical protein
MIAAGVMEKGNPKPRSRCIVALPSFQAPSLNPGGQGGLRRQPDMLRQSCSSASNGRKVWNSL